MAITPISLSRVSYNLRAYNLLESLRASQLGLYGVQNQLATGYKFLQPSQSPTNAASVLNFDRRIDRLNTVNNNLRDVNAILTEGESAASDAISLMDEARRLAVETVSDSSSADERKSLGEIASSLLERMIAVGNREHLNAHLFSGHQTHTPPFAYELGGVIYRGDEGRRATIVDTDFAQDAFTISGKDFFGATSSGVQGNVDLDPLLTLETRVSALRGTASTGVQLGTVEINDGTTIQRVDLRGAATVGDIVDRLNDALPVGVSATLGTVGIVLNFTVGAPSQVTLSDVGGGRVARDLGISGDFLQFGSRAEVDLDPRLEIHTPVATLLGGTGLNLGEQITIRNGAQTATVSFNGAETLEDILNRINASDLGVWARIAPDQRGIEVLNRVSGSSMAIEENLGTLATTLGIRTMRGDTTLSQLNDGRGVETVAGYDFRVTTRNGTIIDVDLDGLSTLQQVIDHLNSVGGGAFTARLAPQGNGLQITDNTVGGGSFSISKLNQSPAIDGLGLTNPAVANVITGDDVNQLRPDGAFTALLELRDALRNDDRDGITIAAQRLERTLEKMHLWQGRLASIAKSMSDRTARVEDETATVRILQSDTRDVDITDAAVRFQQLQTALQANLSTASRIMNLSVMDYLRP